MFLCSAHAKEWTESNFTFRWDDDWTKTSDTDFIRLIANGEKHLAVTIDHLDREAPIEKPCNYAESALPQLAKRHGQVVRTLKREDLERGVILYSVSMYEKKRDKFGIIFVHISPKGRMSQFAVEGKGRPDKFFEPFRQLVLSTRWLNEK